jgi:hypothetical protein
MAIDPDFLMPGFQEDGNRLGHRRDVQRVGQPRAVEIIFSRLENLGLGLQPAKSAGEEDAGKVLLENAPVILAALGVKCVNETLAVKRAVKIVRHFATLESGSILCEADKSMRFLVNCQRKCKKGVAAFNY